jgi:hypothetical protein
MPTTDRLHKAEWLVAPCSPEQAHALVRRYHYAAGGSNTGTYHGLYRRGTFEPVGVAWWIPPTKTAAAAWWHDWQQVLTLSRLAIAPCVPKNAATFLLMRSVRMLPTAWPCLLTYADTWQGHTGHIYKAAGWEYLGLTEPERVYVKDGVMIARKAGPHTRTHAEMLALGAECIGAFPKHRYRYIRKVHARPYAQQLALEAA